MSKEMRLKEIKIEFLSKLKDYKYIIVLILIALLSLWHYITPDSSPMIHGIWRFSYHIPILIAALNYGKKGGLELQQNTETIKQQNTLTE